MDNPPKYDEPAVVQSQPLVASTTSSYGGDPYRIGYDQSNSSEAPRTAVTLNMMMQSGLQGRPQQQMRTWSTSLCGCCEDCGSCCLITWFAPCYLCCALSPRLGESCCAPICLSLGGQSAPLVYRTKLRAAQGIAGGAIDDCCLATHCTLCVMCQMKRELDYVERCTGMPAF